MLGAYKVRLRVGEDHSHVHKPDLDWGVNFRPIPKCFDSLQNAASELRSSFNLNRFTLVGMPPWTYSYFQLV